MMLFNKVVQKARSILCDSSGKHDQFLSSCGIHWEEDDPITTSETLCSCLYKK